jgi:hypothetical protein
VREWENKRQRGGEGGKAARKREFIPEMFRELELIPEMFLNPMAI